MKKLFVAALLIGTTHTGFAADDPASMAVESREGIFEVVRMYFGPIYLMVRGQMEFDADTVSYNAGKIAELGKMIPDGFRMDTSEADVDTEALDAIWDDIEDFNNKAATMVERAEALAAAAPDGLDATRKAFGGLGGACKACHDDYRQQD